MSSSGFETNEPSGLLVGLETRSAHLVGKDMHINNNRPLHGQHPFDIRAQVFLILNHHGRDVICRGHSAQIRNGEARAAVASNVGFDRNSRSARREWRRTRRYSE